MSRVLFYILCFILVLQTSVYAQRLQIVDETEGYTEYLLENPDGKHLPPFHVLAEYSNGRADFSILEEVTVRKEETLSNIEISALVLSDVSKPVIETINPGKYRGRDVASLSINNIRFGDDHILITETLRFRVGKQSLSQPTGSASNFKSIAEDSPLSTGDWYKIPVPARGIYQLTRGYLQDLGIDVANIDPRNIQIWGTDGYALPEANAEERPELSQFPILVEGESDGSFDSNDRVVFFRNSAHEISRTSGRFSHFIHPYSDSTYIFLTVANENGSRLSVGNAGLTPTRTISTFTDFIWIEEELTKSESRQRSGRYWLGQTIPSTAQNQFVSIFADTIPGLITTEPIRVSGRIYARSLNRTNYDMEMNGTNFRSFSISPIADYDASSGSSALSSSFTNIPVSPAISGDFVEIEMMMRNGDSGANSFVDYLRFEVERTLTAENNRLFFLPPVGGTADEIVTFALNGFSSEPLALDVSDPMSPILLEVSGSNAQYNLVYSSDEENKIYLQGSLFTPPRGRKIGNQNLTGISTYPNYIIVTTNTFLDFAQELADYRTSGDLIPHVVEQADILNEFSGGAKDPSAIRDYIKFLWDRAIEDGQQVPEYLLLFGDTTFDTKNISANALTNYVLTYQSVESTNRIGSYGSDDYFGLLDDNEGNWITNANHRVDIGIGRISAQTRQEASIALDKIYRYENPANYGDWQNLVAFSADDNYPGEAETDLHVLNADGTASVMDVDGSGLRLKKIYLFSYPEETTAAGRQIPGATQDFIDTISDGSLIMNYSGHGNDQILADEDLFTSDYIPQLTNRNKLSLFITATCQFGRYDDIDEQSGAEKLMFADNGGAIASFTTTRVVYTNSSASGDLNYGLNVNLSQVMLNRDSEGRPLRFGDIYRDTKNTDAGSSDNSRRFILLGDPAIRLALPDKKSTITQINDIDVSETDTLVNLRALDRVTLSGMVTNYDGNIDQTFNGEAVITFFDAKRDVSLPQELDWVIEADCFLNRVNDVDCAYKVENDILFKGKAQVEDGAFELELVLPQDLSFSEETGRILLFADSDTETAGGSYTNVNFNGVNSDAEDDGRGPNVEVFLNDENFFNGDLTSNAPTLIVELADSSGINITGTGVGHEITATIDTQPTQTFVLNDFFEGTINDYSRGRIEYPMEEIPEGNYSLTVRAWDVHNNATEENIAFQVAQDGILVVDNVYNYPNPMNNTTAFTFEHNQQGNPLDVDIRIYTLSGRPVQHITEYISNTTSSYASIPWNGRDRDNDRLGNGTYIYVLRVTADTPEGRKSTEKIEKLVIIR